MYGYSVGKLRIYQKPFSLNFEDILIDDDAHDDINDDKKKYLVFSIEGTQGNAWVEGVASLKVLNENFQIVIEAVTGHTMMSDIAIDDISILLDDDCIAEIQATTAQMIEEDDDVFDVQSCTGRCFKDDNTMITVVNAKKLCNCDNDCLFSYTCCPDFVDVCYNESNSSATTVATPTTVANPTTVTTSTTVATPTTAIPITTVTTPKVETTSNKTTIPTIVTTPKIEPTTRNATAATTVNTPITTTPTTVKYIILTPTTKSTPVLIPTTIKQTIPSTTTTTTTTTTAKPVVTVKTTSSTTQEPMKNIIDEMTDDDEILAASSEESLDYFNKDTIDIKNPLETAQISSSPSNDSTSSSNSIIYTIISLVTVTTILIIAANVAYQRYKSSRDPLNYKQNRRGKSTTKNVTEEFSEVRFLTEDECLDFNIASSQSSLTPNTE